jgi:hypothetical protein
MSSWTREFVAAWWSASPQKTTYVCLGQALERERERERYRGHERKVSLI